MYSIEGIMPHNSDFCNLCFSRSSCFYLGNICIIFLVVSYYIYKVLMSFAISIYFLPRGAKLEEED